MALFPADPVMTEKASDEVKSDQSGEILSSDLFGLARHGSEVKSTPLLQSKSNAPYLDRNNSNLYRLTRYFGSNWHECLRLSK